MLINKNSNDLTEDWWDILKISPNASVRDIHQAFEILRLSHLPINRDRLRPLSADATEQLKKIDRAFRLALDQNNQKSIFNKTPVKVKATNKPVIEKSTLTVNQLLKQAKAQDFNAAYILGLKYETGDGVEDHCIEAARWYLIAAEHGHRDAKYRLGLLYKSGLGVIRNLKLAQTWTQSAAKDGCEPAVQEQLIIAKLIQEEEQLAESQFLSGVKCEIGEGLVSSDYPEAARLYRLAAQGGHRKAQFNLSLLYRQGLGVTKDVAEADRWLKRSKSRPN
jgi:TPR repeat protein